MEINKVVLLLATLTLMPVYTNAQKLDSINYENGKLYYHEYGKGIPIILLTGGPGDSYAYLEEMAKHVSSNYRVILLEQRGTGRSIPDPFDSTTINLSNAVSDLLLLLDHLQIKQGIICGHSWGGDLAMYFATAHPERVKSLILLSPGDFSLGKELNIAFELNRITHWSISEKHLIDSLNLRLKNNTISQREMYQLRNTEYLAYVSEKEKLDSIFVYLNFPVNMKCRTLLENEALNSTIDFKKTLKNLNKPVYIICGRQDFLAYCSYELKIAYPEFELFWIQNSGHYLMYEQPKEFYAILFNVLKRIK